MPPTPRRGETENIASQSSTIESARDNPREAVEGFFEWAGPAEVEQRLGGEVFVTRPEVALPSK